MSRSRRLLDLMQILRRHRRPVTGARLARELGISLRTVYRDVEALIAEGADIAGEAGVGYVLRPGFLLPPLMFSDDEIEALVLGSRWVMRHADPALAAAAADALAKIRAVLPADLRESADATGLLAGPGGPIAPDGIDLAPLRWAIRREHRIRLGYRDRAGKASERIVWPIAIGFFERVRVLAAWCELRQGYRHFRTDRMTALADTGLRYPRRRRALIREWRDSEGVPEQ
ncbi:MAG TPA: YafY family protein [Stellaceae bacterium]|nr:YafY family protein [Stellaceae bacterium]